MSACSRAPIFQDVWKCPDCDYKSQRQFNVTRHMMLVHAQVQITNDGQNVTNSDQNVIDKCQNVMNFCQNVIVEDQNVTNGFKCLSCYKML